MHVQFAGSATAVCSIKVTKPKYMQAKLRDAVPKPDHLGAKLGVRRAIAPLLQAHQEVYCMQCLHLKSFNYDEVGYDAPSRLGAMLF